MHFILACTSSGVQFLYQYMLIHGIFECYFLGLSLCARLYPFVTITPVSGFLYPAGFPGEFNAYLLYANVFCIRGVSLNRALHSMMQVCMVFCEIIDKIIFYWCPKYVKTTLFGVVSYTVKRHIDLYRAL